MREIEKLFLEFAQKYCQVGYGLWSYITPLHVAFIDFCVIDKGCDIKWLTNISKDVDNTEILAKSLLNIRIRGSNIYTILEGITLVTYPAKIPEHVASLMTEITNMCEVSVNNAIKDQVKTAVPEHIISQIPNKIQSTFYEIMEMIIFGKKNNQCTLLLIKQFLEVHGHELSLDVTRFISQKLNTD